MKKISRIAALAAVALIAGGIAVAARAQGPEPSIALVNKSGVRDWQASGEDKIFIQDSAGKWYLVTLASASADLPYATAIGFETKGVDRLDKTGSIVVAGTRYPLASLAEGGPPPPKQKG